MNSWAQLLVVVHAKYSMKFILEFFLFLVSKRWSGELSRPCFGMDLHHPGGDSTVSMSISYTVYDVTQENVLRDTAAEFNDLFYLL